LFLNVPFHRVGTYISSLDGGSADTSTGAIAGFLLNMVLHPEIQQKAQAEIDRVVGSERLPTFAE
jgi:cytochrome P450